jgi:4-amino-4-deoxy-L-arabinose transferase-like glycosyltransferase
VLTKGPIAIVLPAIVFGAYLLLRRELPRIREMMIPVGALIVTVIVLPWYAILYSRYGWTYIGSFLLGENVARYTEGYGVDSMRGPIFYLPVLFSDSFPWSAFLIAAAVAGLRSRRSTIADERVTRFRLLLWLWVGVIVLFFSMSAGKQDLYIFPIVPAVAALAGLTIARGLAQEARAARAIRITTAAVGLIVVFIAAGVVYLFREGGSNYALGGALMTSILGIAGGMMVTALALSYRLWGSLVALAVTFIALNWVFVLRVLPSFEAYKPSPAFARTLASRLTPETVVATYDEALPSLVFYLRRHVEQLFEEDRIIALLEGNRPAYAILSRENYAAIASGLDARTCVIESRPTFDVKLKTVLAREPLPELVLVTNRCVEPSAPRPTP